VLETYAYAHTGSYAKDLLAACPQGVVRVSIHEAAALPASIIVAIERLIPHIDVPGERRSSRELPRAAYARSVSLGSALLTRSPRPRASRLRHRHRVTALSGLPPC